MIKRRIIGFLLILLLFSSMYIAPIYGATENTGIDDSKLEAIFNSTMNHIKSKVHGVSDYECSQLLYIMYNHSNQHQGFDFYAKYISGQDTEDLYHKSPYYKQYVDYWDNKLVEYSNMPLEEKAKFFNVVGDKEAEIDRLIRENNTSKIAYCYAKSSEPKIQMSKSVTKLEDAAHKLDMNKMKQAKDEFEKNLDDFYDDFINAGIEFDIEPLEYKYDSDAFQNALAVKDEINSASGRNFNLDNGFLDGRLQNIEVGNIVQYKVQNGDYPIYKYYQLKSKDDESMNVATLDLFLNKNSAGEIINCGLRENRAILSISKLTEENTPYIIRDDATRDASVGDLFRAYRTDPTGINAKILKMSPKPGNTAKGFSIAGMTAGAALIVAGAIIAIVAGCTGVGAPVVGIGLAMVGAGIGILVSSGVSFGDWKEDEENYKNDMKSIENIISRHNNAFLS
ncbi:MAG: hypothetical protein LBR24_03975 [Methanobrevibacter sp.]|nr:hypothetical protein [Methanobrevibacter sp.]